MGSEDSGNQAGLFPDIGAPVVYEQPLNERIRNCLRLEHLFIGIKSNVTSVNVWNARTALTHMVEISDFLVRTDAKGELIKELERETATFQGLRSNPGVDVDALDKTVATIDNLLPRLKTPDCQPGDRLRKDDLANQVRQRINIPGGACSFDLPALHFWLSLEPEQRAEQMVKWMEDLKIIETATHTILGLIRGSSSPKMVTAKDGFYQQQIDSSVPCQIIRVVVGQAEEIYPKISAGKHRFTIRFYSQQKTDSRPVQVESDTNFELQCCGI